MKKHWIRIIAILATLVLAIQAAAYFAEDPAREYVERELNTRLKDYSVSISKLNLNPLRLSADLRNIVIRQKETPDPPLAEIAGIRGGVHWRELLTGHIVGDAEIDSPKLYVDAGKLTAEIEKPPSQKEAWQDTIEAITPLTVNEFRIRNGEITYFESARSEPLRISGILFVAKNVKNVKSPERVYPSQIFLEAMLFGSGKIRAIGEADFLLKPFMGVKADFEVEGVDLAAFGSKAKLAGLNIRKGTATATGSFEYSPRIRILNLRDVTVRGPEIDLIYAPQPEKKEPPPEKMKKPELTLTAKIIRITAGNVGILNKNAEPGYRVFMNDLDLEIRNFSNGFSRGPADLFLKGQFMGSGETAVTGTFRPEKRGADFQIRVAVKKTEMRDMNKIFRAYGKFDVTGGFFSFYSEMTVKDGKVTGYVKPLFRDMKVYDKRQDREKGEFRKLYEEIVGGIAKLLENPREAVATKTPVEGRLGKAEVGTWEAIVNIFRNAFLHSILPGFEKNIK